MTIYMVCQMTSVLLPLFAAKWLFPEGHAVNQYVRSVLAPLSTGVYLLFFNIRLSLQIHPDLPQHKPGTVRFMLMTHSSSIDFMVVTTGWWIIHQFYGSPLCIVKKELLNMPFIGWLQRGAGSVPVSRSGDTTAAKTSLVIAETRGREGYVISGFPEGTRRRTPSVGRDQIQPLKKGLFHVANNLQKSGQNVVYTPLVLIGGNAAWPSTRLFPITESKVTMRYGEPIHMLPDESVDDITARVRSRMQDELEKAGAVDSSTGKYAPNKAFDMGTEVNLWSVYGLEAVLMFLPAAIVFACACCGVL